jgi:molybdenum-dependent DNA-binding transcriptional regulator ModE
MRAPMEKMAKQVSRFVDVSGLKKVAEGFGWIRNAAMGVVRSLVEIIPLLGTLTGAASIAGMVKLVTSFASWNRQLAITADSMGMTTDQVQTFETAIRLVGGTAQDADSAMAGLYDTATKFVRGETTPALTSFMGRLGINFRDANGHMRDMKDMLPEVIDKIAAIEQPADRAAAAQAFLGSSGMKVVEAFRIQHKTMEDAQRDASHFATLTDDEKKALEGFYTAQNRAGVEFDNLGQKIAALSADHLTPLVTWFTDFVDKHQPEILAAVGKIEDKFSEWTKAIATWLADPGNWDVLVGYLKKVADILGTIVDALKWIADNAQWFTNPSKKLGLPENTIGNITHPLRAEKKITDALSSPPSWAVGAANWMRRQVGAAPLPGGSAAPNTLAPATPGNAPAVQLPGDTSWGDYGTRANNPGNMNYAGWQSAQGKFSYTDPQTGGAHTMAVYNTMQEGIADQVRLLQRNQAQYGKTIAGALHGYAENPYINKLGVDPSKPFDVATADPETLASVLAAQYKQEGRRGSHSATREQILGGIDLARGNQQVAAVPPATLNGSVDVSITHKNPPPDSAVTAKGSGQVNVAPPRVEFQDFSTV